MAEQDTHGIDPHERLSRHLDWNLLRTYIAIVQFGGISRAAEQLHQTQPAVSQALKRLESQLECRLIDRNTRQFDVTESGRRLYTKALEIHTQISRLGDVVADDEDTIVGHLRLLFASRLESKLLDRIVARFHRRHPTITLQIDILPSIEIQALIQQGVASAGFCLLRGKPQDIEADVLMHQYFGLYCGPAHPLFGRSDLDAEHLRHEDFVTFPSDQMGNVLSPLAVYREQHMYDGRVVATSYNLDELIRLTRLGVGIGILPMHVVKDQVEQKQLWRLPPTGGIGPIDVFLIWNVAAEMSSAEQVFLEFARAMIASQPASSLYPAAELI